MCLAAYSTHQAKAGNVPAFVMLAIDRFLSLPSHPRWDPTPETRPL